ncbi:hypothetical protein [Aliivibrio logei]|uniref:DUF4105 domain-containing protein n=1 Tax=Aliivibrio logei 5S-186 TaxID=626086 RepID=A0ABX3B0S3_ALILO|nr:hypothetical protein [Aliivibrio logei]OEF22474.1 hypothetical protein A1Q5_15450 [Aliivibrio logei 5S-186]
MKRMITATSALVTLALYTGAVNAGQYMNGHRVELKGDKNIDYPQLCIRINRKAQRIPLLETYQQFQTDYPDDTTAELLKRMVAWADSGAVGHTWVDLFYKDDNGKIKADGYGFGSDGNQETREFSFQKCVHIEDKDHEQIKQEMNDKQEALYVESKEIAKLFFNIGKDWNGGRYTLYGNCAWFAGELFNSLVPKKEKINFAQAFDWSTIVPTLLPLSKLKDLPDPGYIAESLSQTINSAGWYDNDNAGFGKITGDTFIIADADGLVTGPRSIIDYYPGLKDYATFISAGYYSESQNRMHFFTYNLKQDVEITTKPYSSDASFKNINQKFVAAFHHPSDDTIGMAITEEGNILDIDSLEKMDNSALQEYAGEITAASNYFEGDKILILLRPDGNQYDDHQSNGVRFVKYDFEHDKVLTEPKLAENLSGFDFFKLQ